MKSAARFAAPYKLTLCGVLIGSLFVLPLGAQVITTVAGNAINDNRPALQTTMVKPQGIAFDANGNLIVADRGTFVVRRMPLTTGNATVLAGGGTKFDDAIPVPGKSAALDYPVGVAVHSNGDIYFTDYNDHRVRKISNTGCNQPPCVTTIAGTGEWGYSGDGGPATAAEMALPTGIAIDRSMLYVADSDNFVIRRINLATGVITTYAGNGEWGYTGDNGQATRANLARIEGLAVDSAGNLYLADSSNDVVRKVAANGIITTVVPASAGVYSPTGLAVHPSGALYISAWGNDRVVRLESNGSLTVIAGGDVRVLPQDNVPANNALIYGPIGLAFDSSGNNLYIAEEGWNLIRRVELSSGLIRTVAGTLDVLDNRPALTAPLSFPIGMTLDTAGNIYIADTFHHRIRQITGTTIRSLAGTGLPQSAPDGPGAVSRSLSFPMTVSVDGPGNLYITENFTMVRKIDAATKALTRVAGRADDSGYAGDGGPATSALLDSPFTAVADTAGNLYISDSGNQCVRKVDTSGIIRTVAGICKQEGYGGDGGPAALAKFSYPRALFLDQANGYLYIADTGNSLVRRLVLGTGVIQRVAGVPGRSGYSGDDGPALEAEIDFPNSVYLDRAGTLYISDGYNHVVRIVRNGRISTLAGVGVSGFAGDGLAPTFAFLNTPTAVAVDGSGNVYILDTDNNRLRRISAATALVPRLEVTPASLSFTAAQGGAPPAPQTIFIKNASAGPMLWRADVSANAPWLRLSETGGAAPAAPRVLVNTRDVAVGDYQGTITISAPGASNQPLNIAVTLKVTAPETPVLTLSSQFVTFDALQGGAAPDSQILSITNSRSGELNWGAQFITNRGGNWLSVSPSAGTVRAGDAAGTAVVSVNPANLAPGLYLGLITVANFTGGTSTPVAVSLIVGAPATNILLTQHSFVFTIVRGSTAVPTQSLQVLNTGQGAMNWQALSFVPSGNWLRITPASGTSQAGAGTSSPAVTLGVDPSSLTEGVYGGLAIINAPGARNNPQFVTVVARILKEGTPPAPQVQPTGLLLTATAAGSPVVQEVGVQSTGGGTLNFTAGARTQDGGSWLTVSPSSGSLVSATERVRLRVQVSPASLTAGVRRGAVSLSFSDGSTREVQVAAIIREPGVGTSADTGRPAAACAPSQQVLVSTRLANNFALPTSYPVPLAVRVNDNCGTSVVNSTVAASFSNGDSPIVLQNLRDGQYIGTWVPTRLPSVATSAVSVSMRSLHPSLQEANVELTGALGDDKSMPFISDGGVVNGASFAQFKPLSPGSIFSLFGGNLNTGQPAFVERLPLATELGGVKVKVGNYEAPLFYSGSGQVNAQVPFELAGSASASVVVSRGGVVSASRSIQLDANQPGIFKVGDSQGAILIANTAYMAAPENSIPGRLTRAAARDEYLSIYCTGLGPVSNQPASGAAAKDNPLSYTTTAPSVTIGGMAATVVFSGLAPGFVGVYQVDVQVPQGAPSGNAVPLIMTMGQVESNTVTVAIQ